jgi:hypothetical protein
MQILFSALIVGTVSFFSNETILPQRFKHSVHHGKAAR